MLNPGDRIGDWTVVLPLGQGGMGSVYRCRHALSERIEAAVKVLKPTDVRAARARFIREAEALHALRHPAIVRITGFGEDAGTGLLWIAMELVHGKDFDQLLQKRAFPLDKVPSAFAAIAEGLAYAHARGIAHRDLKPANLMLQADGSPVILDFGIAVQEGQDRLTQEGVVPGTVAYAAPEQVTGGKRSDPALADMYALGQVLSECLSGGFTYPRSPDVPEHRRSVQILKAKLKIAPLDPGAGVAPRLRELVRRATEPDPARRGPPLATWPAILRAGGALEEPSSSYTALRAAPPSQPPPPSDESVVLQLVSRDDVSLEDIVVAGVEPGLAGDSRPRVDPGTSLPPWPKAESKPSLPPMTALPGAPPPAGPDRGTATGTATGGTATGTVGNAWWWAGGAAALVLVSGGVLVVAAGAAGAALWWAFRQPVPPPAAPPVDLREVIAVPPEPEPEPAPPPAPTEADSAVSPPAPSRARPAPAPKADGRLVLAADVTAGVMLDGVFLRETPVTRRIPPGRHEVVLTGTDGAKKQFVVHIEPDETVRRVWSFRDGEWRSFEGGIEEEGLPARPQVAEAQRRFTESSSVSACLAAHPDVEVSTFSFVIAPDGSVVAEGLAGDARGTALDGCLKAASRKLVFGPSLAGAAVTAPVRR